MIYKISVTTTNKDFVHKIAKKFSNLFFVLKTSKKFITVIKAPFVFKTSRDQFFFQTFKFTFVLKVTSTISPVFLESLLMYTFKNANTYILNFKIIKEETNMTF